MPMGTHPQNRRHATARRILLCPLVLITCLAWTAPGFAQTGPGTPAPPAAAGDPAASPRQPVAVVPAAEDVQIADRLLRILRATDWFKSPRVSVRDGVVFLDGQAKTQDQKLWAGKLAESTEGTVAVVNRINVEADVRSTFGRAGEEFASIYQSAVQAWPLIALAFVIGLVTWLVARVAAFLARHVLARRISSPLLLAVVVRAWSIPIYLLGIYLMLQVAGLTRLAITVLGGTGLAGIIIGFAFRDIAENFLASLLLSIRNPFRSGDLIEVAGHTGVVQNLNTRSTVLLTLDGNHVQIPNGTVFKSTIKNFSSIPSRRAEFTVGIGYDSSTSKAQALIADVLTRHTAVLNDPEPQVLVDLLGDAAVNLRISYWYDSSVYSPAKINSALLRQTKAALLKGGIELPDPAREVVFPKGVPLLRMPRTPREEGATSAPVSAPTPETFHGDDSAATAAEGDLTSETTDVRRRSEGAIPEATENLLKA